MSRPTEIQIDLSALKHNLQQAQRLSPNSHTVAVIKADAYGHGAVDIAKALQNDVAMFAVSSAQEAMDLRNEGIALPILLLEGCFSVNELKAAYLQGFEVVMHNHCQVGMLDSVDSSQPINVWLKVDTGMHRLGFNESDVANVFATLASNKKVNKIVLMTHLSIADETDDVFTQHQLERFSRSYDTVSEMTSQSIETSIANSAGIMGWPNSRSQWDRPGIMLYGLSPFASNQSNSLSIQPVMTLTSKIIALRTIQAGESVGYGNTWRASKESVIATIAVGYGDGYPRNAKSGTPVIVNGQRAALCGRVSMDMLSVDVTGLTDVTLGAEVELWGKNLSANEVAKWAQTIGYELVTRLPKRLPRRIVE